ncbi:MAG: nuclear transport factor 2 family protein [Rhodobacteraceae bacterium]|nr:nuclear transport factor 2 family protein [Paracoccaceae bacterium]
MAIPVEDRIAVEDLLTEFCWRVDHARAETVAELFIADGKIVTPMFTAHGRDQIAEHFRNRDRQGDILSRHQWMNLRLEPVSPTRLKAEMVVQTYLAKGAPPSSTPGLMVGDSLDVFEKGSDGVWRFAERQLRVIFKTEIVPPAGGHSSP